MTIEVVLLVNLLAAVGMGAMSVYLFRQRRAMQERAIAFQEELASSRWMKFVPFFWPALFAPARRRSFQADLLVGVALLALMSFVLLADFVANVVHVFRASLAP